LRRTAIAGGLLTLSRLPVTAQPIDPPARGLQFLTAREADIFRAVGDRMVASDDPAMPRFRDTEAVLTIDQALLQLDGELQTQVRWLLKIFQWGPPVFLLRLSTFTGLREGEQDEYIRGWAGSSRELRRLAFRALKNLSLLGYYSQKAVWPAIHYQGPWIPRPRRFVRLDSPTG